MEVGDALNVAENALRDVVELVLRKAVGPDWLSQIGVAEDRIAEWKARRADEPRRRPGGEVEERLLYYSEFQDVVGLIQKHWDKGFHECFGNRKRFDVYADRLAAFRNPDAHSRALMPFERSLLLGMSGELRQEIGMYLSQGGGASEREHFARIEEIRDSFGWRAVGHGVEPTTHGRSAITLRPGDEVVFLGKAWDPDGGPIRWRIWLANRQERVFLDGSEIEWAWRIEVRDIAEKSDVLFSIESDRGYNRYGDGSDDRVLMQYRVLPALR